MTSIKFIRCNVCGNLFGVVNDSGVIPVCCNQLMQEISANTTDAATEKHVPVIERKGDVVTVRVGSVAHPMQDAHYIQWIALAQGNRVQRVRLNPGEAPEAVFALCGDEPVTAYEYCNLHGLWKASE